MIWVWAHVYTCAPLWQPWECLMGMCVFMCECMESMCKVHGYGRLGSPKTHSSFRWVLQALNLRLGQREMDVRQGMPSLG